MSRLQIADSVLAQKVIKSWGPDGKPLAQSGIICAYSGLVAVADNNSRQFDRVIKLLEGPVDAVDVPVALPPKLTAYGT